MTEFMKFQACAIARRDLPESEKAYYHTKAAKDMEEYTVNLKAWEERNPHVRESHAKSTKRKDKS